MDIETDNLVLGGGYSLPPRKGLRVCLKLEIDMFINTNKRKRKHPRRVHTATPIFCEKCGSRMAQNPTSSLFHCGESRCNFTLGKDSVLKKQKARLKLSAILTRKRKEEQEKANAM